MVSLFIDRPLVSWHEEILIFFQLNSIEMCWSPKVSIDITFAGLHNVTYYWHKFIMCARAYINVHDSIANTNFRDNIAIDTMYVLANIIV